MMPQPGTIRTSMVAIAALCALSGPVRAQVPHEHSSSKVTVTTNVDSLLSRVKSAVAAYRVLDSAVAAGYAGNVKQCIDNPPHGAMGYHHVNRALRDDRIELERPEILVYAYDGAGRYKLNGVEYIVPYSARGPDAEPPTVMGQALKRADGLQLWYLHVWLWEPNPNGVFADWNPAVRC